MSGVPIFNVTTGKWTSGEEADRIRAEEARIRACDPYRACRQDLFRVLCNYPDDDVIKALEKTLQEWKARHAQA